MEKEFKEFQICSLAALVFYNIFAIRSGFSMQDASNKVVIGTFILVNLSLIMQSILIFSAYRAGKLSHVFYHFPLIKIGLWGLAGIVFMIVVILFVPNFPNWIGAIGCMMIACITVFASIKAKKTADYLESIDDRILNQTDFIRSMTTVSKQLIQKTDSKEIRKECQKVYELFRYADPMSTEDLIELEGEIQVLFSRLIEAVKKSELEQVQMISNEIQQKIQERNSKLLRRK